MQQNIFISFFHYRGVCTCMSGRELQWMVMFLLGWLWTGCFKALFTVIILKRMHPWNKKNLVYIMPTDDYWFYYSHDLCGCSTDVWHIQGEMHCQFLSAGTLVFCTLLHLKIWKQWQEPESRIRLTRCLQVEETHRGQQEGFILQNVLFADPHLLMGTPSSLIDPQLLTGTLSSLIVQAGDT